MYAKCCLINCF